MTTSCARYFATAISAYLPSLLKSAAASGDRSCAGGERVAHGGRECTGFRAAKKHGYRVAGGISGDDVGFTVAVDVDHCDGSRRGSHGERTARRGCERAGPITEKDRYCVADGIGGATMSRFAVSVQVSATATAWGNDPTGKAPAAGEAAQAISSRIALRMMLPEFAVTRSGLPSPLKSPTATASGNNPTGKGLPGAAGEPG